MRRHSISFVHAAEGVLYALKTQPNFIVHLLIASLVVCLGRWLRINDTEWAILIITISGGLVIELVNTAIESVVDLITLENHHLAKIAKDCASGAMLVYSIGAAVVGLIIFLPKLWLYS